MNDTSTNSAVDAESGADHDDIFENYPRVANYQVPPLKKECGWAFLYRLAEVNGYVGSQQVLEYYDSLFKRPLPAFVPNFHWLCLAPRYIEPISTWLDGSPGVALLDEAGKATKRFCPDCIREGRPFLAEWSEELRVCWMHRTRLQDKCWSCKRGLSWMSGSWDACACGASLQEPPRKPFRFGTDSYPTVDEWEVFERMDKRERELQHQTEVLEDVLERMKEPYPWDPEFFERFPPGHPRREALNTGPLPENFNKPFKVFWDKQESGGYLIRRVYE
jgi:hypothetical protein